MTDLERRYAGVSCIAWGYLFNYFNFNLGTINLLPKFVAFLLFLNAIKHLKEDRRDLALLKPLGLLLGGWYAVDWCLTIFGGGLEGHFALPDVLVSALSLYFHFQLLTDCAALAAEYQKPGSRVDEWLRLARTAQTILITAVALSGQLLAGLGTYGEAAVVILSIIGIILAISITRAMFVLRWVFRSQEA